MSRIVVSNPFDGREVGSVADMLPEAAPALLRAASDGARTCRALSRHERSRVLDACADLVEQDRAAFAALIVAETGKTIRQATKEVARCVSTLRLSAHEARRSAGEVIPFDAYAGSENRQGWFTREPLGVNYGASPPRAGKHAAGKGRGKRRKGRQERRTQAGRGSLWVEASAVSCV